MSVYSFVVCFITIEQLGKQAFAVLGILPYPPENYCSTS